MSHPQHGQTKDRQEPACSHTVRGGAEVRDPGLDPPCACLQGQTTRSEVPTPRPSMRSSAGLPPGVLSWRRGPGHRSRPRRWLCANPFSRAGQQGPKQAGAAYCPLSSDTVSF